MPYSEDEAARVGRNVFRKQLLPVGTIEYEGRTLDFSRDYLAGLAQNFNGGAVDQVPFQLADAENRHTFDPERTRGEVKGLELGDDGLYGIVELTDEGAQVVGENPKLGVSARIIQRSEDGGDALQHVLGTLDPRVTGMAPWEAVSLTAPEAGVVDLTAASFSSPVAPPTPPTPPRQPDAPTPELDAEAILARMLADNEPEAPELSQADRQAIELAQSTAQRAQRDAAETRAELARVRFEHQREELTAAGVPPHLIDLAEPVLRGGEGVIELANGTKADAHDVVRKLLDGFKGTIDLTAPLGVGGGEEGSQAAEAKALSEKWAEESNV